MKYRLFGSIAALLVLLFIYAVVNSGDEQTTVEEEIPVFTE